MKRAFTILTEKSRGLYRSRDGVVMGVCKGIADHFDLSLKWVRFSFVLLLFLSGFWPMVGIYFLASFVMRPAPVRPFENDDEKDFYESYVHSRKGAIRSLGKRFKNMEKRIRRMEDIVTTKEFEWDQKFNADVNGG